MISRTSMPKNRSNSTNSGGLNAWMWTVGKFVLMYRSRSSYHSIGSRSFMPPCMRICVPPIATSSRIFSPICS